MEFKRLTGILERLGDDDLLKDLRDLPKAFEDAELGGVRVHVGSGEVEITGTPGHRLFQPGPGAAGSSDPVIRHTSEADGASGEITTYESHKSSGAHEESGPGEGNRAAILVRYDQFSPANAFLRPDAVTYDRSKVPAGAGIMVARKATGHGTTVRLQVRGLLPDRTYGAHVHTKPCGARPDDSGPHYQHRKDPVQPSTNPRYANPRNEVWLDFTTDGQGSGGAVSRHSWTFREGEAGSVVLHEKGTSSKPGHAGQAGARVACFSVPLSGS
ncbi:superoxide dismutase family protein [Streptomyces oryzae]|uniref:Superoxide dismutase family protein n=2 Tax=Streptomyces oryzae TaxID=1434886 RepID=A0ABS3XML3_9ACTN|nr:superoxide dismutase family protein [Streptomyces oryzae]